MYDLATRTAEQVFMPLTIGGGVRTVEDVRNLLFGPAGRQGQFSTPPPWPTPDVIARRRRQVR